MTAELGHRVYFTSAIEMARRLTKALAENHLSREMNNLTRPKLLIIDEVGYLALEPVQASLLFQVISNRYERGGSIILTSNKAFGDWARARSAERENRRRAAGEPRGGDVAADAASVGAGVRAGTLAGSDIGG